MVVVGATNVLQCVFYHLLHCLHRIGKRVVLTRRRLQARQFRIVMGRLRVIGLLFRGLVRRLLYRLVHFGMQELIYRRLMTTLQRVSRFLSNFLRLSPGKVCRGVLLTRQLMVFRDPFRRLHRVQIRYATRKAVKQGHRSHCPHRKSFLNVKQLRKDVHARGIHRGLARLPLVERRVLGPPLHLVRFNEYRRLRDQYCLTYALSKTCSVFCLFR